MNVVRHQPPRTAERPGLLEDHRLERWLASTRREPAGRPPQRRQEPYHWTQRVQYAVGHAVNRYYEAAPTFRKHADAGELVDYRWPRRIAYFDSEESYWTLKDRVTQHLRSFFEENGHEGQRPVLLYEKFEVHVPGLELDLSMIFQLAWQGQGGAGLHLQRFVVDNDPRVLEGYRHAARVFCRQAFGAEPSKIEAYAVLSGERIGLDAAGDTYEDSLDYLRLAYGGMHEGGAAACSCGRCRQEQAEEGAARSAYVC